MTEVGFAVGYQEAAQIWRNNAQRWPGLTSPWRPSSGDIEVYKKLSGNKLKGNVLILGATPELRDLVAREASRPPTLVDSSITMLLKASELLKDANPNREIWIKADWCEAPLHDFDFDLVIADMVWWVISVSKQLELRDTLCRVLKNDGFFVSRFRFQDPLYNARNPLNIVDEFVLKLRRSSNNSDAIQNMLLSALYDATADTQYKRISRDTVKKILVDAADRTTNAAEKNFLLRTASRIVGADWTLQRKEEILERIEEKFNYLDESRAQDYNSDHYPILKFLKK